MFVQQFGAEGACLAHIQELLQHLGVGGACWDHNPEVVGSKPTGANRFLFVVAFLLPLPLLFPWQLRYAQTAALQSPTDWPVCATIQLPAAS